MKSETVGRLRQSLLPVFVIALTSMSAKADYIYDAYHSTGVADSKKVLQVRLNGDEVEVRTLCRQDKDLTDCADPIVIKKDRLDAVAALENAQYQNLINGFKKDSEKDAKTKKVVGGSLSMTALGLAYPPAAPIAIPLGLLLEGAGIVYHQTKSEAEPAKKRDPRLETMSASVIQKALTQDVAVSDYRKGDEIEQLRLNLKDLFSSSTPDQEQMSRNPAITLGFAKAQESQAALSLLEAEGSELRSAQ